MSMTPTDTIREALRRCPVKDADGWELGINDGKYPNSPFVYINPYRRNPRPPHQHIACSDFDAHNAMIAKWVEAFLRIGRQIDPDVRIEADRVTILFDTDNGEIEFSGPTFQATFIDALAAAVCAVMPEPTT